MEIKNKEEVNNDLIKFYPYSPKDYRSRENLSMSVQKSQR